MRVQLSRLERVTDNDEVLGSNPSTRTNSKAPNQNGELFLNKGCQLSGRAPGLHPGDASSILARSTKVYLPKKLPRGFAVK